jgi:hypothetical protein
MTRGAAISMALLAIIVVALIVLLAWPTHSARSHETGEPPTKSAKSLLNHMLGAKEKPAEPEE